MATLPFEVICAPGKYGYKECSHCHGYGSSLSDPGDTRCTVCQGSGIVIKTPEELTGEELPLPAGPEQEKP